METSGNTVLITGGASGIGFALAKRFLKEGNTLIVLGRNAEKLEKAKSVFPGLITYQCDISDTAQVDDLMVELEREHSSLNVLVNNAGIQYNYDFLEDPKTLSKIRQEIDINLTAPLRLSSLLLPLLTQQEEAAIVNVGSALGSVPKENAPVYCASKAGLHAFSTALRYQLESTNVKVFELIPPLVDTEMTQKRGSGKLSPDEVADAFWKDFQRDCYEVLVGKAKALRVLSRFLPGIAAKIIRNS